MRNEDQLSFADLEASSLAERFVFASSSGTQSTEPFHIVPAARVRGGVLASAGCGSSIRQLLTGETRNGSKTVRVWLPDYWPCDVRPSALMIEDPSHAQQAVRSVVSGSDYRA